MAPSNALTWPVQVTRSQADCGSKGCLGPYDPSWVSPPQAVWFSYMTELGVQGAAQAYQNVLAAVTGQSQAMAATASPGVNPNTYGQTSTSTAPTSPTAHPQAVQGTSMGQFTLFNQTTGNSSVFRVGDTYLVQITGATPNTTVYATGTFNGSTTTNNMGSTDGSGNFQLSGQMYQNDVGQWQEVWDVGNAQVGSVSFQVILPQQTVNAQSGGMPVAPQGSVASYTPGGTTGPTIPPVQVIQT